MYADEERRHWRECFERGVRLPMYYLDEYRRNSKDSTWRSTRVLEQMCEYILYLEDQLEAHEKSRSDGSCVKCVKCRKVLN